MFGVAAVVLGVPLTDVGLLFAVRELMLAVERFVHVMLMLLLLLMAYCRLVEVVFIVGFQLAATVDAALPLQSSGGWRQRSSLIVRCPKDPGGGCGGELKVELARWSGLRCGRCNYDRIVGGYL